MYEANSLTLTGYLTVGIHGVFMSVGCPTRDSSTIYCSLCRVQKICHSLKLLNNSQQTDGTLKIFVDIQNIIGKSHKHTVKEKIK